MYMFAQQYFSNIFMLNFLSTVCYIWYITKCKYLEQAYDMKLMIKLGESFLLFFSSGTTVLKTKIHYMYIKNSLPDFCMGVMVLIVREQHK
jgi:hypothetical protein